MRVIRCSSSILRRSVRVGPRTNSANVTVRRFSSDQSNQFDFRVSQLGLVPQWIRPSLPTISQLPEVESAVQVLQGKTKPTPTVQTDLERASQVLASMPQEHAAVLALKAELQQRLGHPKKAYQTVCELSKQKHSINDTMALSLAKAKTAWYLGDFDQTATLCQEILDQENILDFPLHYASALTGFGLSKLLTCSNLDEAYTVRDPCRMALKFLELRAQANHPMGNYPLVAAAHLNLGVAEAIYARAVGDHRKLNVPLDPALKVWSEGITLLEHLEDDDTNDIANALIVRLETNMAWGILKIDDGMDDIIPEATEHAALALTCSDKITRLDNPDKEYFRRILTVLANCYHKAGKAVTAEGLLQTATTLPSIGCTLTKIDERNSFGCYSSLCKDWDKRGGDAEKMRVKAMEVDKQLPESWQGKDAVLSSAWFWTPGDFQ